MKLGRRWYDVHGGQHGTFTWIARALDQSPEHVSKVLRGERSQTLYYEALVELLEACPKDRWPERWRKKDAVG